MNYIWEVVLAAQEQGQTMADITFCPAQFPNPYLETAFTDLNQTSLTEPVVEINALYRFGFIFQSLLSDSLEYDPQIKETIFDILMHYLAVIDLRQGLYRLEYYKQFLQADFVAKDFGAQYQELFAAFDKLQGRYLAAYLLGQYKTGTSLFYLRKIIKAFYPQAIVYLDLNKEKEILIYIGKRETPELRRQVTYLCDAFMPFDCVAHLFWDMHFGIIGIDETMMIDEIMIF